MCTDPKASLLRIICADFWYRRMLWDCDSESILIIKLQQSLCIWYCAYASNRYSHCLKGLFRNFKICFICYILLSYGTAQLQGIICLRPERIQDASRTCAKCVWNVRAWDASEMRKRCIRASTKPRDKAINCHALFCHVGCILNVCGTHLGCMTGTFQMHVNVSLELSRTIYTDNRKVPNTVTC